MSRDSERGAVGGEGAPEGLYASPETRIRDIHREIAARLEAMPERIDELNQRFVEFVRERPMVALAGACALGYVLGRIFRRVL